MLSGVLEGQPLQFCDRHRRPRLEGSSVSPVRQTLPHARSLRPSLCHCE